MTEPVTVDELDEAIRHAWESCRAAMLEGSPHLAEVAMQAIDRRLEERLAAVGES